ncbi:hypothetical protein [Bartonella choladocola]|uniref:Uncharacterized protein n=1 Tax=Bartonella choladocola TaxID=2750995 RepID=A0A1U9MJZ6_9HYPH|nr:hypothetical protein [Bartonella choladocola]AQT48002.1 hypothetical protein BBC0122_019070 [Bartonella choladocola]
MSRLKTDNNGYYTIKHSDGRITKIRLNENLTTGMVNIISIDFPHGGLTIKLEDLVDEKLSSTVELCKEDLETLLLSFQDDTSIC